ncbi:MAG: Extra-cytoplasmic solute receptor [Hyphomicrobiales bacterium]|nr:Extra-cytoplasmic solute receptor [Hyphomicrobiales bacterium]
MDTRHALTFGLLAAIAAAAPAQAQTYPSQNVSFVSAYQAGSSSDSIVRFISEKLRPLMGRTVIVENKPGANASIATEYVVRQKPDGHTILIHAGSALAANMHLLKDPPVDVGKSLQAVATINRQAFMLGVSANQPWKSVADLTAAMKPKGAKASYAAYASTSTIMGQLYNKAAGLQAVEVGYRLGADSMNDLASGALDFGMYDPAFALAQEKAGRMRILAVAAPERMSSAPHVPTFVENGIPDIVLMGWFAAFVPAGTPKPIVNQLNAWISQAVDQPDTREFLNRVGSDPWITPSAEQAQAYLLKDIEEYGARIREAGIKPQ